LCGPARESGDLDQRIAIRAPGRDLEVLRVVLDDPLGAVVIRYAKRLHQRSVDRLEQPPPLRERPSLHDLNPDMRPSRSPPGHDDPTAHASDYQSPCSREWIRQSAGRRWSREAVTNFTVMAE